MLFGIDTFSIN